MTGDPTSLADSGVAAQRSRLRVREMQLSEVGIRIDYFHDASDDHLFILGVDRALLPSRAAWREFYEADYARPVRDRENYSLAWEFDDQIVGFSSADQITFGEQAFMHQHILDTSHRRSGMGTQFLRKSAAIYFQVLKLLPAERVQHRPQQNAAACRLSLRVHPADGAEPDQLSSTRDSLDAGRPPT